MKNPVFKRWRRCIPFIFGSAFVLTFWTAVFAQTAGEPKEKIELGTEGKSIQEEPPPKDTYAYIPGERRDPFVSLIRRGETPGEYKDELSPLQKVDLSELKLVGIIKDAEGNTAIIQTQNGKGYFLRQGVAIGKNEGVVEKILEDKVVVKEKKTNYLGQIEVTEAVLILKKKEERGGK